MIAGDSLVVCGSSYLPPYLTLGTDFRLSDLRSSGGSSAGVGVICLGVLVLSSGQQVRYLSLLELAVVAGCWCARCAFVTSEQNTALNTIIRHKCLKDFFLKKSPFFCSALEHVGGVEGKEEDWLHLH